ncbi:hypothetical protein [Vibrio alginolyticus]
MEKDWAHLQHERKKITSQVMLQQDLETCRAENKLKDEDELFEEAHHPTCVLPEQAMISRLQRVKHKLLHGGYPQKIIEKKDTSWSGQS